MINHIQKNISIKKADKKRDRSLITAVPFHYSVI